MDYNLNNQNKSPMMTNYKMKYKKKMQSNGSCKNIYGNEVFNKSSSKLKADFKYRTSKNSPLYTKRKIEMNEDTNSGLFTGRIKKNSNEDLFTQRLKKLYKKSIQYNDSSNMISNSKNESSSIIPNKLNKAKNLFYSNYNNSNFDYNSKLNHYVARNSSEEMSNMNNLNNHGNVSLRQNDKKFINNLGLKKHIENKENKTINDSLFKKISNNKQYKHQSMAKMKKTTNIHYLYNYHNMNNNFNNVSSNIQQKNNYSKYIKNYNDNNSSGVNLISKKLNKIMSQNDCTAIDYNKLNKTSYLSKNNSGKNSSEKNNVKNNYNIYCFNSKLIQRNDDKTKDSINNIKNNESSRALYDSMNKNIKPNNNNEIINSSNYKSITKLKNNNSKIYKIYNDKIDEENLINNNKNNVTKKDISLYDYINSPKKYFYLIKSTPDINYNNNKILSSNRQRSSLLKESYNKVSNIQNLNLNSISNKTNLIDNKFNSNTNRTNDNYYNNINFYKEVSDVIYKKKISLKSKERIKSSPLYTKNKNLSKSNSFLEHEESSNNKIKTGNNFGSKQDINKQKLTKSILPFSNYQSPLEKSQKIVNNYVINTQRERDGKLLSKESSNDNKSGSLINNNYYIGINLDKNIINNICYTSREPNSYITSKLISNNNSQNDIKYENNNYIIINQNNTKSNNYVNINQDDKKMKEKDFTKKKKNYKHYNSQELLKGIKKDLKSLSNKLITIELNKKEYHKRKLIDKRIIIKDKDKNANNVGDKNNYDNYMDMLYIPPDKVLKQDTIHLTTNASLDCYYYKNEREKLSKYIKKYFNENGIYPETRKDFYLYGRQIGHGAFGKVNIALHVASGRLVAIKTFNKKNLKKKNAKQKIKNEIEMLSKLRHPFISQILDSFETDTHIFIVMEYICGDLLGFIRKRGKLSEPVSKIIFKQLIEGLKYIHSKKIVHRDIKLDNILIDLTNTIKICDFGVSRKIGINEIMHEHCGTPAYIAPEIFENRGYSGYQCDIWSAGVTLYYILGGIQPFRANSIKDLEQKIITGDFEPIEDISDEANELIKLILRTDPTKRINEDKILNHSWLANIKTENRKKLNLFTDAEKILLSKYDVDYLTSDKDELIENFTMKNLETNENENLKNAVGGTKSVIYAPYNTYIEPNEDKSKYKSDIEIDSIYKEIEFNNDLCKYGFKVQQANIKYELSNNQDFDNGIIKTAKEEDLKQENEKIEKQDFKNKNDISSYDNNFRAKSANDSYEEGDIIKINEKVLNDIEKNVGYDKRYILDCLRRNVINYATATYYLLSREDEADN